MLKTCDDYCCNHGCNQGDNCPARIERVEDAGAVVSTILDLIFACAMCFATFVVVYVAGVFMGVWK